jgi:hypothetical protein
MSYKSDIALYYKDELLLRKPQVASEAEMPLLTSLAKYCLDVGLDADYLYAESFRYGGDDCRPFPTIFSASDLLQRDDGFDKGLPLTGTERGAFAASIINASKRHGDVKRENVKGLLQLFQAAVEESDDGSYSVTGLPGGFTLRLDHFPCILEARKIICRWYAAGLTLMCLPQCDLDDSDTKEGASEGPYPE